MVHKSLGGFTRVRNIISEHPLWTIFAIALGVRLLNIAHIAVSGGSFLIEDSGLFGIFAPEWMRSLGLLAGDPRPIGYGERVPLYPLFVGLMQVLGLGAPIYLVLANCVFDAGSCVLVGLIGCLIDRRLGLIAGLLGALWPNLVVHSGIVLSDSFFLLLFSAMLYWSALVLKNADAKAVTVAGCFLGLAILVRPVVQFLPIAMAVALLGIAKGQGRLWREAVLLVLVFCVAVAGLVAPLVIHNKIRFDSFALSNQGGTHLLNWVVPAVREMEDGTPRAATIRALQVALKDRLAAKVGAGVSPSSFVVSSVQTPLALEKLASSSPIAIAKAWAKGMVENMASPAILIDPRVRALATQSFFALEAPNFGVKVWRYVSGNGLVYLVLFVIGALGSIATLCLAAYGYVMLWRRNLWAAVFAGLAVLYFLLVNGPVASPKYRLPFEPIMVILTALGGLGVWDWWRGRSTAEPGVS